MLIGYYLGDNLDLFIDLVKKSPYVTIAILIVAIILFILAFFYYRKYKKNNKLN